MRFLTITCPFCWQSFEIDSPSFDEQPIELITDCEVCCRPMTVRITWRSPAEEPEIEVEAES